MRIVAFAGPSLTAGDRAAFESVEWLPPAGAGDLLRLLPRPPPVVCLIDGWFDHRPAVRHKEILLLLAGGVRIFGASSIGALRAAEMAPFGMTGVGAIYRAYASGRLTGDDEVALVHAPERWDWRPLTVPLVDLRATLCRAVRARAIDAGEARAIQVSARRIHYADRDWPSILAGARLPSGAAARFAESLDRLLVEQKRTDALACLEAASGAFSGSPERPAAVRTVFLEALARQCGVPLDPWPT